MPFYSQARADPNDKQSVSALIENARKIMDTAVDAERAGMDPTDWTIFIGPEGGLEMIAGSDNSLDSLAWNRGARMAWQVRHLGGSVRVEGQAARERCQFELESPRQTARMILGATAMYQLAQAA
jgi:hypothetical protein